MYSASPNGLGVVDVIYFILKNLENTVFAKKSMTSTFEVYVLAAGWGILLWVKDYLDKHDKFV